MSILNNTLPWDGSHLGQFNRNIITNRWSVLRAKYVELEFEQGYLYANIKSCDNLLPCIIEDIKPLFNINKRGIHRITLSKKDYIIYFVPIDEHGNIVWETPLNKIPTTHFLRRDEVFRKSVQQLLAFCDILSLCGTAEYSIIIRSEKVVINTNDIMTSVIDHDDYDCTVLNKTSFLKWFGENTSLVNTVKEMINFTEDKDIVIVTTELRNSIDTIIKYYDKELIWFGYFIIDRLSRKLLIS